MVLKGKCFKCNYFGSQWTKVEVGMEVLKNGKDVAIREIDDKDLERVCNRVNLVIVYFGFESWVVPEDYRNDVTALLHKGKLE